MVLWYEFKDERGRIESGTEIETVVQSTTKRSDEKKGEVRKSICPGGEIGRRKGLKILSTQTGNFWCEWSQIRGNLSGNADGNPELSFEMM